MIHPHTFGKYRLIRKLPGGAMGTVYQAIDTTANVMVALKLIDHGTDADTREILEAERRGATLHERLSRLDERIPKIHEYGDLDGHFYLAMEFVEGHDLAELLSGGGIGVPFATRIAADVCGVLEHAHNLQYQFGGQEYHGVVHGDIKPRNIRITSGGAVKLLDFGIAKALSETRMYTRNLFGSVQYSSPERLKSGDVDASSDLWAVAVVLYEAVAHKPYFQAESPSKTEHAIRNYTQARELPASLPAPLRAILLKALCPDPRERYLSAGSFRNDLLAFLEDRPVAALLDRDAEATRRTSRADGEDTAATRRTTAAATLEDLPEEATRRTAPRPAPTQEPTPVPPARTPRRANAKWRAARRLIALACLLLGLLLVWHEVSLARDAGELRTDLQSERLKDLDEAWKRYDAMAQSSYFPFLLRPARTALLDKMLQKTDATINAYRNSDTVREGDWIRARDVAARALTLVPGDRDVTGRVRLAQGHINRIRGGASKGSKLVAQAREQFEEAARLLPRSPDPQLALARLYVYNLRDVDSAEDALRGAEKRGFRLRERETGLLADGHRFRGDQFVREADKADRSSEEKDYLERARKSYRRAQELYDSIVPYGDSADSLRQLHETLATIDVRLESVKNEGAWR